MEKEKLVTQKSQTKLNLSTSVAYIISIIGISPLVALPAAIAYNGWFGFVVFAFLMVINLVIAILLGKTWLLVEEFYPDEIHLFVKNPYAGLALKAGGENLKKFVQVWLNLALFGEAFPFLIIASSSIQGVVGGLGIDNSAAFSLCYVMIFITLVLTPIYWLASPKDLKEVIWIGLTSVVITFILLVWLLLTNIPSSPQSFGSNFYSFIKFPLAYLFGSVAFQLAVHPVLLTLQLDMEDKKQLSTALIISFSISFGALAILSFIAYMIWGTALRSNILSNFPQGILLTVTKAAAAVQFLVCLCLSVNPLFISIEESLGIPDMFGWRRVIVRSAISFGILFVAESIPHFGVLMELVGGLLLTPVVFILPPFFYCSIKSKTKGTLEPESLLMSTFFALLGTVGCIATCVESAIQLSSLREFAPPCYVRLAV